ncbi:hypothetical protein KCP71_25065 [Salmonella enterica subsp. enterica]|nr:hypothetical protein KCP71_25065 [Salmonella enterica subsp. enterica]
MKEMARLRVRVSFDKDKRTLTALPIAGMNRDEVIDHLGTIAKSGKSFLQINEVPHVSGRKIASSSVSLAWLLLRDIVADKVTVRTRAAGDKPENGVF